MTDAEQLRAMAQWYRDGRTFTPEWGEDDTCGCFLHAAKSVSGYSCSLRQDSMLRRVASESMLDSELIRRGWTGRECTDDAIAACEIAADLAS